MEDRTGGERENDQEGERETKKNRGSRAGKQGIRQGEESAVNEGNGWRMRERRGTFRSPKILKTHVPQFYNNFIDNDCLLVSVRSTLQRDDNRTLPKSGAPISHCSYCPRRTPGFHWDFTIA